MSDQPCIVCGTFGHDVVVVRGVQVQACPHVPVERAAMFRALQKDGTSPGFPRLDRPPREVYVRSSRPTEGGAIVEPGIEYRDGDDFTTMAGFLNYDMFKADAGPATSDPKVIAEAVEARIKERWPDRAYFVEVHDPRGGWIQIFQPFGVPRNR